MTQALPIRDLSTRPSDDIILALLDSDQRFWTADYNAYWNISTGDLSILPYTKSSYGVPLFAKGLAQIKGMTEGQLLDQFKTVVWRRIEFLKDYLDHQGGKLSDIAFARRLWWGHYLVAEFGPDLYTAMLNGLIKNASAQEIMRTVDEFGLEEMNVSMDRLRGWDVELFELLDPRKPVHALFAAGMLAQMAGKRADEKKTAIFITFIGGVIDLKNDGGLNDENVDVVFEIAQSAQRMEWTVNDETLRHLTELNAGRGDLTPLLDSARNYWLIQEYSEYGQATR